MADVLHRTTLEFLVSVSTDRFPEPTYMVVPNPSANRTIIDTVEQKYWVLEVNTLREMNAAEKLVVDTANTDAQRDAEIGGTVDELESVIRALMLIIMDELNDEFAARVNSILAAADSPNYNAFQTAMQAITDAPTRTPVQLRNAIRNRLGS